MVVKDVPTHESAAEDPRRDAARITELLWGARERPGRGPKPVLSLEEIARAGIAIADAEGLPAVSMRRVAERLGFTTMALYRHVPNKTALLAVMIDTAIGDMPPPAAKPAGWREQLAAWAWQIWTGFGRRPWLMQAEVAFPMTGPHKMAWIESGLRILDGLGLDVAEMSESVLFVYTYAYGAVQFSLDWAHDDVAAAEDEHLLMRRVAHDDRFPLMRAMIAAGAWDTADEIEALDSYRRSFEFGLQRALDGIEALIAARAPRPGS